MPDTVTNLASANLRAPQIVLAPASEFLVVGGGGADAAMHTAQKMRMGTRWVGVHGTFGTVTKAALKHLGDMKAQPGTAPGQERARNWTKLGYTLSLTVHHDRGLPPLRLADRITAWVETGKTAAAELIRFHITSLGADKGDEDTATMEIEITHIKGLDDQTAVQIIRAEVDELGRVISFNGGNIVDAAGTDPALGLPTAHV